MSLGLHAVGSIRQGGLFARKQSGRALAQRLKEWLELRHRDVLYREVTISQEGSTLCLLASLHPAGGEVTVEIDSKGRVTLVSTTNPVGPGFHAFVCEIIDAIANEFRVVWSDVVDETDYFVDRDFDILQRKMTEWIHNVAALIVEEMSEYSNLAISMQFERRPTLDTGLIATPSGPRQNDWLRSVARKHDEGRDFFAWWSRRWDRQERVNWLNAALWNITSFERARCQEEADTQRLVLRYAATLLDDGIQLDAMVADLADLSRAEGGTFDHLFAGRGGGGVIGYRRLQATYAIWQGWSITLPGHFAIRVEDNTWMAYDYERTVRFSSYTGNADSPEALLESFPVDDGFDSLPLEKRDNTVYRINYGPGTPKDNCEWLVSCGAVNLPNLGILTIAASRRYRDWAVETAHTLSFDPHE